MNKFLSIILSFCFFIANSQTTILNENFSSGIPSTWTTNVLTNNTCGAFQYQNSQTWAPSTILGPHISAWSYSPTSSTPCQSGTYILIPFIGSGYNSVDIGFDHFFGNYQNRDTAQIFYSINGGSSWTFLQEFTGSTTSGTLNYNITNLSSNMLLALQHKGYNGFGWDIDNIVITGNSNSVAASWDCDPSTGGCTDPGTGFGAFSSLAACQSACIVACTHTFNMYDSWGDGWEGASVDVIVNGVTVVNGATGIDNSTSNNPGPCGSEPFQALPGDNISLSNWDPGSYPPSNGEISWDIKDVYGNIIAFGGTLAAGGGYGLSGNCTGSCPAPSWTCDGSTGGCYDPGTGQGQYSSLASCQSACVVASWDCDPSTGGCYDPGTSQGQYNSLASCQSACVAVSWTCDGSTGGCYDPGTGQGQYGSLAACQASCRATLSSNPSVPVDNILFLVPSINPPTTILPHPTNPSNYLNPGKIVRFKVEVENKLSINLNSLQIIMTPANSSDPYVTVTTNQSGLNNITAGASRYTLSEFEIVIDSSCPPGHIFYADFQVINQITSTSYSSTGYPIFIQPLINVEQSSPGVAPGTLIDDDSNPDSNGDDDHIVDPNETIELTPVLQESSNSLLTQLSVNSMRGCLKNLNNYPYVNIWSGVQGATGNVYSCLSSSFAGGWNVQQIQNNNYVLPPYDFVFDYTNTSTCKFDLFIEFKATTNYQFDPAFLTRYSEINWLTKVTINPNESPCNLPAPSWDCDPTTNTCSDPGNGSGTYASLVSCQNNCVATPTWDCNNNTCSDPGTGFGAFSSLAACQSVCNPTSTPFHEISNKIFPNPFKDKAFLELVGNDTESVLLFDIMGQFLREYKNIADKLIIERGNLSSGTYFLKIINKNSSIIQKIVVE